MKATNWAADNVERRKTALLVPSAKNARLHSDAQIEQIAASIEEWGWTNPVLIDESDTIIAGHGRVLAALQLGIDEVPVAICTGWSKAQKRAYVLADNQLAMNAGWDMKLLKSELDALKKWGFDVDLIGFDTPMDPASEWKGMPEFSLEDKRAFRTIRVHFQDQDAVDRFAEILGQPLSPRTQFFWFPHIERSPYDTEYASDEDAAVPDLHSVEGQG